MIVDVKFCGLTRASDATEAGALGARYAGVIFAESPRRLTSDEARTVLAALPEGTRRVGVFGSTDPEALGAMAQALALDVVQLHADPTADDVRRVRRVFAGTVWAALRLAGATLPPVAGELFASADGVVVDARNSHQLGGTGEQFDWGGAGPAIHRVRGGTTLILAGGLTPANVAEGMRLLRPDIVDVSSGVERSAGVKDHQRMRAFVHAVFNGAGGRSAGE